jgi:hypothetical protein
MKRFVALRGELSLTPRSSAIHPIVRRPLFTYSRLLLQNISSYVSAGVTTVTFRGWLLMVLFAHVMLHPWVHGIRAGTAADQPTISGNAGDLQNSAIAGDRCELCRVGHNTTVAPRLPQTDLLNPQWIQTALHAVNYASLQADLRRPSRAPPIL